MKAFEVVKGHADVRKCTHGRVMMAIEGENSRIEQAYKAMKEDGFDSADYAEDGDKEGTTAYFFIVDRADKEYFMKMWKVHKNFA